MTKKKPFKFNTDRNCSKRLNSPIKGCKDTFHIAKTATKSLFNHQTAGIPIDVSFNFTYPKQSDPNQGSHS